MDSIYNDQDLPTIISIFSRLLSGINRKKGFTAMFLCLIVIVKEALRERQALARAHHLNKLTEEQPHWQMQDFVAVYAESAYGGCAADDVW